MSEVYYPGDYVKFSFGGDVDYGTVVRMGSYCDVHHPDRVLVDWESGCGQLDAGLNQVSLIRRAAKEQPAINAADKMRVADLKKLLEKMDDNMYVSGIHSLSFHFGKGS